ncbi:SOS response-associated peptidase [Pseudogulbenkiania subflava]|uniref:Abasic site processing protein n=1 Tax=Pseudogulbenkiania subflava DSM 22618 TaxID=1123014 RepID=A0A1Y6CJW3_9NEIS|nr:SOS response-associated peptidase [Pseudogulbenkiania subflava]SMF58436.1 Putative SOS response-associated peptidase YedK [Pseudogulbenkiania subflava DSM 22618]
MCGRYAIYTPFRGLWQQLELDFASPPRYNIAPTQNIPIIRRAARGGVEVAEAHWGLIPFWAKDRKIGYSTINARAETVAEKPAFRAAFKHRRCIIPASGLYEWQDLGGKQKQPWFITDAEGDGLGFAGLWERWTDPATAEAIDSCTIIVGPANDLVRPIHDRLACILPPEHYRDWLDPEAPGPFLQSLLTPCPSERLRMWPVSARVGNPRHDGPDLVEPVLGA